MSFKEMIEELKTRLTPEVRDTIRTIWKGINIGILGLNSFLLMYFREQPNPGRIMAYYGAIFIWVALWGTKCLWIQSLYSKVLNLYRANEERIIVFSGNCPADEFR